MWQTVFVVPWSALSANVLVSGIRLRQDGTASEFESGMKHWTLRGGKVNKHRDVQPSPGGARGTGCAHGLPARGERRVVQAVPGRRGAEWSSSPGSQRAPPGGERSASPLSLRTA